MLIHRVGELRLNHQDRFGQSGVWEKFIGDKENINFTENPYNFV